MKNKIILILFAGLACTPYGDKFTTAGGSGTGGGSGGGTTGPTTPVPLWGVLYDSFNSTPVVKTMLRDGNTLYVGGSNLTRVSPNTGGGAVLDTTTGIAPTGVIPRTINGTVNAVVPDGSGGWYIGGNFTKVGNDTRNRIARINADGSLHSWAPEATGGTQINALALSGTTLYVGGDFTLIGGQPRSRLAAVDTTTGLATAFNPGVSTGSVNKLLLSGATLFVTLSTTSVTIGGQTRSYLAAIDTTLNTSNTTAWNPLPNGLVNAIAVSGTLLYAGGNFTTIGGQPRNRLAALDTTLSTNNATTWNPGATGTVDALLISGTTLYAGFGQSITIGGQARSGLAALDTTIDTNNAKTWNPGLSGVNCFGVKTLILSGNIIFAGFSVAGGACTIGGQVRKGIVAVDTTIDTNNATSWDPSATIDAGDPGSVLALAISGTAIYAGGSFTRIGQVVRNGIAAIDLTTGRPTSFDPNPNGDVNTLALSGTTLYVGGSFTTIGGQTRNRIAAFDTSTGAPTAWDPNATSGVVNVIRVSGSTVYVGGSFSSIGGQTRGGLAALNATVNTNNATAWNPATSITVNDIVLSGTTMYVGFSTSAAIGGQTRARLAALDTTVNTNMATTWNPGVSTGTVNALALSGTTLYVGLSGTGTTIGGQSRNYIAALDTTTDTNNATAWNPGAVGGAVNTLAFSGSAIYAGGAFTTIGGGARNRIAALDKTADTNNATTWDPNADGTVNAILVTDNVIYVAGSFDNIGGQARASIAALKTSDGTAY